MVGAAIKTPNSPTPPPAQKPRPATPSREGGGRRPGRPAPFVRIAVTIFILWHFTGVFLAAMCVPESSKLVFDIAQRRPMQWYLDATYMNQGHSFFAPEVGPSHLIRYQLYDQSNREIEHGEFPSRKEHWPRLLYHRYFMLAEQSELPFFDDKPTFDAWQRKFLEAYGRYLLSVNKDAQTVRLQRYSHLVPPSRFFVKDPKSTDPTPIDSRAVLTDPKSYELLIDVQQRRSDLAPLPSNQGMYTPNNYWQQGRPETASRWSGAPR